MSNISGTIAAIRTILWQDTGLNGDAQRIEHLPVLVIDRDKDLPYILNCSAYPEKIYRAHNAKR